MLRNCDVCGVQYEAKRPNSRFHSDTCRKRHQRGARVAPVRAVPTRVGLVEQATRAELDEAGRLGSALGQVAVALAARLDDGRDTGQGAASLSKELRAVMAAALADVTAAADPIDELRSWRDRKRAAAR